MKGHTKTVNILKTAYSLLLFTRKKKNDWFLMAKNTPARGVCYLLRFNMYLFLAQGDQVYLFFAFSHN